MSEHLGPFKLNMVHLIDCLPALRQMPDECIDAIITSPPYWGQRGAPGIGIEEDPRDFIENLTTIFSECNRVLKNTGVIWINLGDSYNTPINWSSKDYIYSTLGVDKQGFDKNNKAYTKNRGKRRAFIEKGTPWLQYGNLLAIPQRLIVSLCNRGLLFRGEVIWVKRKPMPEGLCRRPHRRHEGIYLFSKSERHNFQTKPPVPSVWDLKQVNNFTDHTSTFPIELPARCIEASAIPKGGVVLDPFMGSGTTGLAAKLSGIDFIGFDIDTASVEVANKRIEAGCITGSSLIIQDKKSPSPQQLFEAE